jgi:hypothetical protein
MRVLTGMPAVPGEVRAFRAGEQEEAVAWAAAAPEKP